MNRHFTVRLGAVAEIERRGISPSDIVAGTTYVGLEHIPSGGSGVSSATVEAGELGSTKFRFTGDHILYGKLRPYLAKIVAPDFSGVCSTDILPIKPGPQIDKRFLLHYLRLPENVAWAAGRATGVNLPRLSPGELADLSIPLPGLDEQRRIAAILDNADALRQKRKRAIALLDSLTQSIFLEMFGNVDTNDRGWANGLTLEDVAEIGSGITKGRPDRGMALRDVPYMAVANVQERHLDLSQVKTIAASETEIAKFRLQPGDLLLTEGGDPDKLGRGSLWSGELPEAIHQNHIFRVRFDADQVVPLFGNWLIGSSRGKAYFMKSAKQTTGIASINKTQLSRFPMLLPPVGVQRNFAAAAIAVRSRHDHLLTAANELNALFASLQHRAFSGRV